MKGAKKYLKKRIDTIIGLLEKPPHTFSSATFHQLRVEIKKVDALCDLINYCSRKFKRDKSFQPFEDIFSQAGKVRDYHIEKEMMKKYFFFAALREYRTNLKKAQLVDEKAFFLKINKSLLSKIRDSYAEITPFMDDINESKINAYLNDKRKKIHHLLVRSILPTRQIHDLRTHLKTYYYIIKNRNLHLRISASAKKDVLTPVLGKWHDIQIIINNLEKTIKFVSQSEKNVKRLEIIKINMIADSNQLLAKAYRTVPSTEFLMVIKNPNK